MSAHPHITTQPARGTHQKNASTTSCDHSATNTKSHRSRSYVSLYAISTPVSQAVLENITFLAQNYMADTSRMISASDLFVVMRGWTGDGVAKTGGAIAILVRCLEATMGVVKATFEASEGVVEKLCVKMDEMLGRHFDPFDDGALRE